jgi:predicted glycoside hydrolase/deacetylase ChbG (UPF0249 family)
MVENSFIEKLGYSKTDKVVIIHIDDIGFSHSSNIAAFECLDFGITSCGSVIVPSPWFFETVSILKQNPNYDIGVHLTLTAEYDTYRWKALSSVDPATGLLAEDGCLWKTSEEAITNVTSEAAEYEMRAQIEYAINCGIDITHIDSHMGTVFDPKFIQSYLSLADEFRIPAFIPRLTSQELISMGFGEYIDLFQALLKSLEEKGIPLMDHMIIDTGGKYPDKSQYYCDLLAEIKPGLTHLLCHPAKMSSELRGITPDSAEWRDQDYQAFTDNRLQECIEKFELNIIGYQKIRDIFRNYK